VISIACVQATSPLVRERSTVQSCPAAPENPLGVKGSEASTPVSPIAQTRTHHDMRSGHMPCSAIERLHLFVPALAAWPPAQLPTLLLHMRPNLN
jgi:hypothetical protein